MRRGALTLAAASIRFRRIALADPETVPCGMDAKKWLASRGLWEALYERSGFIVTKAA